MRTKKAIVVRGNKSRKGGRKTPKRNIDLSFAQTKITELNYLLHEKCPNLHLHLDFVRNLPGTLTRYTTVVGPTTRARGDRLLLCLYKGNQCISSIEINLFFHGEITMNSRTERQEEGKKYNKMLRAVVMMVGGLIPGITKLHSVAENPISAWLLVDNFQVEYPPMGNQDFFDYLENINMNEKPLSREQIFDFYADKTI